MQKLIASVAGVGILASSVLAGENALAGGIKGAWRVLLWGTLAQAATAVIGYAFDVTAG